MTLDPKTAELLWKALDPKTAYNDATAALMSLRSMGLKREQIIPQPKQPRHDSGSAGSRTMPFGKHKGMTLDEIAEEHPDYLEWLLENTELREPLKSQIEDVLASV